MYAIKQIDKARLLELHPARKAKIVERLQVGAFVVAGRGFVLLT